MKPPVILLADYTLSLHHSKIPELSMVTSEENPDNSLAKLFSEIYSLKYLRNKTRHDQKKELRNSTTLHASIQQIKDKIKIKMNT